MVTRHSRRCSRFLCVQGKHEMMDAPYEMIQKVVLTLLTVTAIMPAATATAESSAQTLVIGLDGADWGVIKPLLAAGELPHIEQLMENGQYGNLTTTLPIESPVAWTSMSTGTMPGKHGIYGFLEREGSQFVPTDADDVQVDRVWEHAPGESVIINVPQTFPPRSVEGYMISGYLSIPSAGYTHPTSLQEEIEADGYAIEALDERFEPGMADEFLDRLNTTVRNRTRITTKLLDRSNWSLGFIVYTGLDRLQHYLWHHRDESDSSYRDTIDSHYRLLDQQIGRLLSRVDEDTAVMLVSDHGFGPLKKNVYLNTWLRKNDYLEIDGGSGGGGGGWLATIGLTQQNVVDTLSSIGLLDPVTSVFDWIGINPGTSLPAPELSDIDFSRSEAYAGNHGGRIYLTEQVSSDRREAVLDRLEQELMAIKDPETGEPVFDAVHRSEALYGATTANAPDLIIEPKPTYRVVGFLGHQRVVKKPPTKSGTHAREGIYVLDTPGSDGEHDARITDIAPTILDVMGAELPAYMDGTSLLDR